MPPIARSTVAAVPPNTSSTTSSLASAAANLLTYQPTLLAHSKHTDTDSGDEVDKLPKTASAAITRSASNSASNLRALRMNTSTPSNSGTLVDKDATSIEMEDVTSPASITDTLLAHHHVLPVRTISPGLNSSAGASSRRNDWAVFDQGLRFGCMLSLLAWVMWDGIVDARLRPADQDLWVQLILPVYRGMGCLLLLGWCFGFSLYMWEKYKINYAFLFEVDLRNFLTASEVLDSSCNATILYLANFLFYFKIMRGDFPNFIQAGWFPILFLGWMICKIFPWNYWLCGRPSRSLALWAGLMQVIQAPFGKVTFLTGYLGDIWTSMVKVSVDLAYAGCLFFSQDWMVEIETLVPISSGEVVQLNTCFHSPFFKRALIPLLSVLPLWLRFMQCLKRYYNTRRRWPHIGNACKYAVAHSVILFGVYNSSALQSSQTTTYKSAWILCMIASTLYTFSWDVFMDWGLGSWRHGGLREELMFPHKSVYYGAIIIDLFMRFAWTLTLIPQGEDSPFSPDFVLYLQPTLAAGEILRRTMWGMFRLEWEHLSTQSYHRVPDAVAPPSLPSPEMSGYMIIAEVGVLVVIVLCIGTTAALTAN